MQWLSVLNLMALSFGPLCLISCLFRLVTHDYWHLKPFISVTIEVLLTHISCIPPKRLVFLHSALCIGVDPWPTHTMNGHCICPQFRLENDDAALFKKALKLRLLKITICQMQPIYCMLKLVPRPRRDRHNLLNHRGFI